MIVDPNFFNFGQPMHDVDVIRSVQLRFLREHKSHQSRPIFHAVIPQSQVLSLHVLPVCGSNPGFIPYCMPFIADLRGCEPIVSDGSLEQGIVLGENRDDGIDYLLFPGMAGGDGAE